MFTRVRELHDDRETYLLNAYGRPIASSGGLDNKVRKWIIKAGLCIKVTDKNSNKVEKPGAHNLIFEKASRSCSVSGCNNI